MYRLYKNGNIVLENEDLQVLRNNISNMEDTNEVEITYITEDEDGNEVEDTYVESLSGVNVGGNNDYIEFMLMGCESGKVADYKVEIKNLEQLGMETLYNKSNEIKDDLRDLYYQYNGFIPYNVASELIKEKMN